MRLSTHIIVPLCAENGETGAGAVGQLHAFYAEGYLFPRSLANDLADDVLCQLRLIANSCCVEGGVHPGGMQRGGSGGASHSSHEPLNAPKVGTAPLVSRGGF